MSTEPTAPAPSELEPTTPDPGEEPPAEVAELLAAKVYKPFRFIINGKNRCIDVPRSSKERGTTIQLYDCKPAGKRANQEWTIEGYYLDKAGRMAYLIRNRHSQMCLNVKGSSKDNGARLIQWPCNKNHQNSLWYWKRNSYGKGQMLANSNSTKCLNVGGNSAANGAWLIQWTCRKDHPSFALYF
ncbi:hypothetical protein HNP84_005034 [Thermocatellispora tengchongensis]|uniref:Ricin B lectin domain-containing protein n=1 Tax=Thermocatellispora tengchongensis TaxID=1073253 RepID=A0A840P6K1_9ACTN|nr:RICIN domain-containing protein [Thermocatellispora tengchongensis]MBB5135298.1 hypothetical protein [Thermocatellispora tengchongensis]